VRITARSYDLKFSKEYNISRHRYRELKEFCLQYEEKKAELQQIYTSSTVAPEITVKGGMPGNPTENKAMRALKLKSDIELIDNTLNLACEKAVGVIPFLKKNITEGVGFSYLGYVPCSPKLFYKYRRKFFFLLDKEKL
jgi:hypothetical protein